MRVYGRRASSPPITHYLPKGRREYCSLKGYNHRGVLERDYHIENNVLAA